MRLQQQGEYWGMKRCRFCGKVEALPDHHRVCKLTDGDEWRDLLSPNDCCDAFEGGGLLPELAIDVANVGAAT